MHIMTVNMADTAPLDDSPNLKGEKSRRLDVLPFGRSQVLEGKGSKDDVEAK